MSEYIFESNGEKYKIVPENHSWCKVFRELNDPTDNSKKWSLWGYQRSFVIQPLLNKIAAFQTYFDESL